MTSIDVTYSVNGLIGPMTDTIEVPANYTMDDVAAALNTILEEVSTAMNKHITLRHILFAKPSGQIQKFG